MGPLSPYIAGHIALHGSRLLHGQEDLWNTTRRSCGIFECEYLAIWRMFMNTTLQAAVHLGRNYAKNRKWDTLWDNFLVKYKD